MVGFNIAVAVTSLNIASSSSQCNNAKTYFQRSIHSFFQTVGIFTIISLFIFLLVAILLRCGCTMNAGSIWNAISWIILADAIWKVGLYGIFLIATNVLASLKYCPPTFSVFTFVLFAGCGVCLYVSCYWLK